MFGGDGLTRGGGLAFSSHNPRYNGSEKAGHIAYGDDLNCLRNATIRPWFILHLSQPGKGGNVSPFPMPVIIPKNGIN
jgi:hypothetical protein